MKKCIILIAVVIFISASTTLTAQNVVQSGQVIVDLDKHKRPQSSSILQNTQSRGNILENPGFESGVLTPWYTSNWTVTKTSPHTGLYCATDEGNFYIRQDFNGIPVARIKQVTLWSRQPEECIQAVDLYYSDGTYFEDIIWPLKDWQEFDVTSWLSAGKTLVGIRIWGYSGGGPDPDISFIDDVTIILDDLYCDTYTLPVTGGSINFSLDAGAANASRNYILLGSVSGTTPGTQLPGGMASLPLNWDFFTNLVISFINTPVFKDFTGALDASGKASASLNAGAIPGGAVGLSMYFAYTLPFPYDLASTPVKIDIVP